MASRLSLPAPTLWRPTRGDARRVTWIELFFDLVFVAVVAQLGAPLGQHYAPDGVARYAFLLFVTWWAWHGYAVYTTRFDAQDGIQRATTLLQMVAVIFMAANAEADLTSESSAGFAAAYALMRLILVGEYLRASTLAPARQLAREYAAGYGLAAGLWLVSALVPLPARFALWGLALAVDVGTAVLTSRHATSLPPHGEHLPERFGLFTLILLGESIVDAVKGIQSQAGWTPAAAMAALCGIGLLFAMWWSYFEGAAGPADRHVRSRRDARWLEVWSYAHVPLYVGVAVTGLGIEHIVRDAGASPLHAAEAWLLCGAAAAFAIAVSLIGLASDRLLLHAHARLAGSAVAFAGAMLALVPLAPRMMPGMLVMTLAVLMAAHGALIKRWRMR